MADLVKRKDRVGGARHKTTTVDGPQPQLLLHHHQSVSTDWELEVVPAGHTSTASSTTTATSHRAHARNANADDAGALPPQLHHPLGPTDTEQQRGHPQQSRHEVAWTEFHEPTQQEQPEGHDGAPPPRAGDAQPTNTNTTTKRTAASAVPASTALPNVDSKSFIATASPDDLRSALMAKVREAQELRAHLHERVRVYEAQLDARDARILNLEQRLGTLQSQVQPLRADSRTALRLREQLAEQAATIQQLRAQLAAATPDAGAPDLNAQDAAPSREHAELQRHQGKRIAHLEMELDRQHQRARDDAATIARLTAMLDDVRFQPSSSTPTPYFPAEGQETHTVAAFQAQVDFDDDDNDNDDSDNDSSDDGDEAEQEQLLQRGDERALEPKHSGHHHQHHHHHHHHDQKHHHNRETAAELLQTLAQAGGDALRHAIVGDPASAEAPGRHDSERERELEDEIIRLHSELAKSQAQLRSWRHTDFASGHGGNLHLRPGSKSGHSRSGSITPTALTSSIVDSRVQMVDPDFGTMAQMRVRIIELSKEKDRLHAMMRARPCYLRIVDPAADDVEEDDGASSVVSGSSVVSSTATSSTYQQHEHQQNHHQQGYDDYNDPSLTSGRGRNDSFTSASSAGYSWASAPSNHQQRAPPYEAPSVVLSAGARRNYLTPTRRQRPQAHVPTHASAQHAQQHVSRAPAASNRRVSGGAAYGTSTLSSSTPRRVSQGDGDQLSWTALGFDNVTAASSIAASPSRRHSHYQQQQQQQPTAHQQYNGTTAAAGGGYRRASFYCPDDPTRALDFDM
ncbi:hypothetical protein PTSG_03300 [Salpingoeca rosetta]|uniref:Uncharacterized protein n=1 Tax=Salpingoeca rosetta (strain ATCC 50818 / BSB-021) TaxID=946362 RepID=F2U4S6_SALR5|nr:uncharacterized protein PTSG_03300 [Salpingoeca rosetta]EGD82642.1 hypothetical protein PTSG_03300 [Salpingoeca rosetta]|eukprot:XP_004995878.1 hypothetical protein PTSG_03300 [Salpingoeca rosetta]